MCCSPTMLPVTVTSNEGVTPARSVSACGEGSSSSGQVTDAAGIWMIELQGTRIWMPLTSACPPQRLGSVTVGQMEPSTVASERNPVVSN